MKENCGGVEKEMKSTNLFRVWSPQGLQYLGFDVPRVPNTSQVRNFASFRAHSGARYELGFADSLMKVCCALRMWGFGLSPWVGCQNGRGGQQGYIQKYEKV